MTRRGCGEGGGRSPDRRLVERFFLSKITVIVFIALILGALLLSALVPQRVAMTADRINAWRLAHRALLPVVDFLGLHHLYTTPWFAALVFLASVSLSFSSFRQVKAAWRATFRFSPERVPEDAFLCDAPIGAILERRGYFRLPAAPGALRYVKHPWGYWGNALLHVGMVLTIAASLCIALTQQRGVVYLGEGERFPPGGSWLAEEHGMLTSELTLPFSVRLDRLIVTFTPDNHIDQAASALTFSEGNAPEDRRTVGINDILSYRDVTVYQRSDYGDIFLVEFTDGRGARHVASLPIEYPRGLGEAGYADFRFPWLPFGLSAKYYTDVARRSMASPDRDLYLRLVDGGQRELGRVELRTGGTARLGTYAVRLLGNGKWSGLIFVRLNGIPAVFAGFFIIVLGAALNYMTTPREVVARMVDGGFLVAWRAARFPEFYREEGEEVMSELGGEGDSG